MSDVVVGAAYDDSNGADRGAIWVVFLNTDGTVKTQQKITTGVGNFSGVLDDGDSFGVCVSSLGDLNGDSVTDVAIGAFLDDDGGQDRGAVWILFLNRDGSVKSHRKISDLVGNFTGALNTSDGFGNSVALLGDLNRDGVEDIIVGAPFDDDAVSGGLNRGAVWILFLNTDGTVRDRQKISATAGQLQRPLR